jgi:hypothetical protein
MLVSFKTVCELFKRKICLKKFVISILIVRFLTADVLFFFFFLFFLTLPKPNLLFWPFVRLLFFIISSIVDPDLSFDFCGIV